MKQKYMRIKSILRENCWLTRAFIIVLIILAGFTWKWSLNAANRDSNSVRELLKIDVQESGSVETGNYYDDETTIPTS